MSLRATAGRVPVIVGRIETKEAKQSPLTKINLADKTILSNKEIASPRAAPLGAV